MEQVLKTLHDDRSRRAVYVPAIVLIMIFAGFFYMAFNHNQGDAWGWYSLLPTLLVLFAAIYSKKPFESLLVGIGAGLVMADPTNLVEPFSGHLSTVMGNETIIWIVLVCGLMGGLIVLLEKSGCLGSFSEWLQSRIKSKKQSLVVTFCIGVVVFIDDYLNCLAVSSSVKKVTDHYQVSREKLSYIIDSTAAPMCIIVPISTWAVFFSGLLEENELAASGEGLSLYISAIPFMVYGWVALILVFLVAIGVIGDFGPMKAAEARAKAGQPIPPDYVGQGIQSESEALKQTSAVIGMLNFIFPMVLLIVSTIYYEIDLLKGIMLTLAVTIGIYYLQGILTFEQQIKSLFDGFKVMLYPLSTVVAGFMLKEVNDTLGMTQFIIDAVAPFLTKEYLPAIVFVMLAGVVFGTASSWGVFIIAIPIIVPLATSVDASIPLMVGALLSASSFGSHACFFSDSTVLAAQGAGCSPMSHAFTQIPYAILGAVITFGIFVALGHMM